MFVGLPRQRGVGKLEAAADGRCSLSVFYSLTRTETIECPASDIERAYLSPQTRAYAWVDDRMRVGRVTDYLQEESGLVTYEVRFPNGKTRDVSEIDLFARPWSIPEDPAEILAAGGAESQFLHDRRQAAVVALFGLRSATQGMTSLLSAGVEFVPHQVAAVRRVLTDPIQRYLLADEVGLGKTIEAGLIIRQHLIDNPETKVLIVTPQHLCGQWRQELEHKLRLEQFGEAFECIAHADLARVSFAPDLLVVDEAHHLVGIDEGPLEPSARRLGTLAAETPILLLLSATPPLGEERRFLSLLNLLDPATHSLDDEEGFKAKLEQRRDIGRLLLSLDSDSPGLVLRRRAEELMRLFPNDSFVMGTAPNLIEATRDDDADLASLCTSLKEHIADTYRIHQRLIRSRRADAQGWEFMPRGPAVEGGSDTSHVLLEADPAADFVALMAGIEDWRHAAAEEAGDDAQQIALYAKRYVEMLEALGRGRAAFNAKLYELASKNEGTGEVLTALEVLVNALDDRAGLRMMAQSCERLIKTLMSSVGHPKIVAFASDQGAATAYREEIVILAEDVTVGLLLDASPDDQARENDRFREPNTSAILITDQNGEEGLNLTCADAIVHLDLPFSAVRLEQRIGRLDRFGRRQSIIRHRIMLPSDDDESPWAAWFDFLSEGLLIFNRSISDVQFLLEEIEADAFVTLFRDGPEALRTSAPQIAARLVAERKSQDEQYALDRIALSDEPVETFIEALEDAEADEAELEREVDRWMVDALQFKKRPYAWPQEDPFKLSLSKQTLIPKLPWLAEFAVDDNMPLTWRRRVVSRNPEVTLLRPGMPLIDMLERFTLWDDRGTTFVTLRSVAGWPDEPWIGFKLCFVIEPDIVLPDLLAPTFEQRAMQRRAQQYLQPQHHMIHVDSLGGSVVDSSLISILSKPYRGLDQKGPDINLSSRPEILERIIGHDDFKTICRQVRDNASQSLRDLQETASVIQAASERLSADIERHRSRLGRRHSSGDAMALADLEMLQFLVPAIGEPTVRLDAMGCFILVSKDTAL